MTVTPRKFPEVWPFIPAETNVPINENYMYAFFDNGMVVEDKRFDSNANYDTNVLSMKSLLNNDYGIEFDDMSTDPSMLGDQVVIMTGRQFVDQVYKIEPESEDFIITVGRWSNMSEEEANELMDAYFDKPPKK